MYPYSRIHAQQQAQRHSRIIQRRQAPTQNPNLPAWFSDEAAAAPPRRVLRNREAELEEKLRFLKRQDHLPNESYGDLLNRIHLQGRANELARHNARLQAYHQQFLPFKFLTDEPVINDNAASWMLEISQLEKHFPTKHEQALLFCALSELHDQGFIRMRGKYPYTISLTSLGRDVISRLQAEPPIYKQGEVPGYGQDEPPAYPADRD